MRLLCIFCVWVRGLQKGACILSLLGERGAGEQETPKSGLGEEGNSREALRVSGSGEAGQPGRQRSVTVKMSSLEPRGEARRPGGLSPAGLEEISFLRARILLSPKKRDSHHDLAGGPSHCTAHRRLEEEAERLQCWGLPKGGTPGW